VSSRILAIGQARKFIAEETTWGSRSEQQANGALPPPRSRERAKRVSFNAAKMPKETSRPDRGCSTQITPLLEVPQQRCTADPKVNPTELRRIFATDGLSAQQLSPEGGDARFDRIRVGMLEGEGNRGLQLFVATHRDGLARAEPDHVLRELKASNWTIVGGFGRICKGR